MSGCRAGFRRRAEARRCGQNGAVAVEFALVLPLVVIIILGAITGGLAYSHSIGLTNAVREGSRFGATADVASGSWATDVISRTRQFQFDDPAALSAVCAELVQAPSTVVAQGCDGDTTLLGPAPAIPATEAGKCVVRVWAARPFSISLGVAPSIDSVMVRDALARYERETCAP